MVDNILTIILQKRKLRHGERGGARLFNNEFSCELTELIHHQEEGTGAFMRGDPHPFP